MTELIQAKVLKGFRDFLPDQEIKRSQLIETLTTVFRSFGFVPIDTPALEYSEILLRKSEGETEKQVFRFKDQGGRDVALRFDLTVPFARFIAEHKEKLYFPFKRYHIAKVWRGEKPQAGRYREFMQCDFDIVGSDSAATDFEILHLMKTSLEAIGVSDITIRLSHRGIFNRFLSRLNLTQKSEEILRAVDKISKIGQDKVRIQLIEIAGTEAAEKIIRFINGAGDQNQDYLQTLALLENLAGGPDKDTKRMEEVYALIQSHNISSTYIFDPSITRGLDYYTGIVFETFLNKLPTIGSVCSGGRYDNLAGLYMKDKISGVGSSIGLDRLMAGLETLKLTGNAVSFTDMVIFCQDEKNMYEYQSIAYQMRTQGIRCEVFPETKKMIQQYNWAEHKAIPWGLIIHTENSPKKFVLKNLKTRDTYELDSINDILQVIKK